MKSLSEKSINSIMVVLTINRDMVELMERRGISVDDIRQLCFLAKRGILAKKLAEEARDYVSIGWDTDHESDDLMAAVKAVEKKLW